MMHLAIVSSDKADGGVVPTSIHDLFSMKKGEPTVSSASDAPTPPLSPESTLDSPASHVSVLDTTSPDDFGMPETTPERPRMDPPASHFTVVEESPSAPNLITQAIASRKSNAQLDPPSFMTQVLGVMDLACYATQKKEDSPEKMMVQKTLSFSPEWGKAPSRMDSDDDDDIEDNGAYEGDNDDSGVIMRGQGYNDSVYLSETADSSRSLNKSVEHENFEVVWEEDAKKKSRSKGLWGIFRKGVSKNRSMDIHPRVLRTTGASDSEVNATFARTQSNKLGKSSKKKTKISFSSPTESATKNVSRFPPNAPKKNPSKSTSNSSSKQASESKTTLPKKSLFSSSPSPISSKTKLSRMERYTSPPRSRVAAEEEKADEIKSSDLLLESAPKMKLRPLWKGRKPPKRTPRSLNLSPIMEEGISEAPELKVRVPGQNNYLSDTDLIGDEIISVNSEEDEGS
jgi:hypothetical protein